VDEGIHSHEGTSHGGIVARRRQRLDHRTVRCDLSGRGAQQPHVRMRGQERGLPHQTFGQGHVVGVDPRDQRRPGRSQSTIQRRRLSAARLRQDGQAPVADRGQTARRTVGRAIVHDDELEVGQRLAQDAPERLVEPRLAVVHGHHHRHARATHRLTATTRIM
jgi:hypothetical protein